MTKTISDNTDRNIVKIQSKKNGQFVVYFDFLPIPVEMNEGYLNTLLTQKET